MRIDPTSALMVNNDDTGSDNGTCTNNSAKTKNNNEVVCFYHEFFQAGQPKLLHRMQRTTKQVPPVIIVAAESAASQQKEFESVKNQLQDMKERMDSMTDEFETKLANMKANLELDYLRRIKAVEVCYKDLVSTVINNASANANANESSFPPLPSSTNRQTRAISSPIATRTVPPTRSSSSSSSILVRANNAAEDYLVRQRLNLTRSGTSSRTSRHLVRTNNAAEDYLVGQRLNLISSLNRNRNHNHNSRGGIFGNIGIIRNSNNSEVPVRVSQQQQLLSKNKELMSTAIGTPTKQHQLSPSTTYTNGLRLLETFQQMHKH